MKRLSLFIFIDALGWEVLRNREFLEQELPHRRKLRSVFGYSSACVPSILSGKLPQDHGHWSFFYVNETSSPFKGLHWLRYLPFQNRGRVRHLISKGLKKVLGWTGYFQLYNMPFEFINRYDYCEKRDIFAPGGLNKSTQIFEELAAAGISYHVSDWRASEDENLAAIKESMAAEKPRFAFLYMAAMDALLHEVGKENPQVDEKLAWYETQLKSLIQEAEGEYDAVDLFICSDHGMATVKETVNLMADMQALPLEFGADYLAAYDSTMARFWFKNEQARELITEALSRQSCGRVLSREDLEALGCQFEGDQYGELIFLLEPGKIICPSHMGEVPVTGMHGYHPDDADSDAVLLSSCEVGSQVKSISNLKDLMMAEASRP